MLNVTIILYIEPISKDTNVVSIVDVEGIAADKGPSRVLHVRRHGAKLVQFLNKSCGALCIPLIRLILANFHSCQNPGHSKTKSPGVVLLSICKTQRRLLTYSPHQSSFMLSSLSQTSLQMLMWWTRSLLNHLIWRF